MAISITNYVDITSGVGGASIVVTRSLVARLFTANPLLPPQTVVSFDNAAEVASYFGFQSEEYLRAVFYFSWISKNQTQPQSIQFARWVQTAVAPVIIPLQNNGSLLANWTSISSGSFILTMGGFTFTLSGLNFTGAGSLAAVATIIENAIQAESGGGAMWTSATVTYQSSFDGINYSGFFLTGGANGSVSNPINVVVGGGGTDITGIGLLGWLPESSNINGNFLAGAIWSTGSAVETITQTLINSSDASNNFGSFAFLTNLNITLQNVYDAAIWNQTQNVVYMFSVAVLPSNVNTWTSTTPPGVGAIEGVGLTLSPAITTVLLATLVSSSNLVTLDSNSGLTIGMPISGTDIPSGTVVQSLVGTTQITMSNAATGSITENITFSTLQFPEMFPMMIEAATDYNGTNTVQNYEYQQVAGLTPSVSTDASKAAYDSINVNYYGVTQQAGQQIAFYQNGNLQGESITTNLIGMNVYVNEIWLKDAETVALMNLLLSVTEVPANNQGRSQILATLQTVINQALNNGVISVGKQLNSTQKAFIFDETNDPLAWYQVQNNGYYVNCVITSSGNPAVYTATYTLIYSKDDVVSKITGTHTLI
jgi:hypothetical protein